MVFFAQFVQICSSGNLKKKNELAMSKISPVLTTREDGVVIPGLNDNLEQIPETQIDLILHVTRYTE